MKVKRDELRKALEQTKPGLASKEVVEQAVCYVFHNDRVYTYNDEIAVSYPFKTGGITGAVRANELAELVAKLPSDEVEMEFDGGELKLSAKRLRAGLRLDEEIRLPLEELKLPDKWLDLPEKFVEGVGLCLFSCGKDMTKPMLMCVLLSGRYALSCDNFRVTRFDFEEEFFHSDILFPANSAKQIISYRPVKYGLTDGWIHLLTKDNTVFSARVMDEEFPDVEGYLEEEGVEVVFPPELSAALDRAKVFTKSSEFKVDEYVRIEIKRKILKIRGEGEVGWLEETARCDYKGEPLSFYVNPSFFREILTRVDRASIGESMIVFKSGEFEHAMMKVEEDEDE